MSDVMIRVAQIKISIDDSIDKVKELVLKQLRLKEHELLDYRIYKQSIDARRRGKLDFVYTVDVAVKDEEKSWRRSYLMCLKRQILSISIL